MPSELLSETIEFVWLDEDGKIMSPVHRTLGAALGFADEWGINWRRIKRLVESRQAEVRRQLETATSASYAQGQVVKAQNALLKLSKTGKPPNRLRRVVTKTTLEWTDDAEEKAAEIVLAQSDMRMEF